MNDVDAATNLRNEHSFNSWKCKIQNHERFEEIFDIATERQRCSPDQVKSNSMWSQYMFNKPFAPTTLKSYKSRLIKLIYCLIDDRNLDDINNYTLKAEFDSIEHQQAIVDPEELCRRMLELRSVTKETLQLTINFYSNAMALPEYKIPKMVMLPRDKELKNIRDKEKYSVEKDNRYRHHLYREKIKYLNGEYVHDRGLLRGAIVFCIMLGTGMRINEARQLTIENLNTLIKRVTFGVILILKRKRNRINALNNIKNKPLELAREIYIKHPTILQISKNTSTPFKDFKRLLEEAGVEMDRPRSNMIRHYLCSNQYNNGMPLQKVAKLMNHESWKSTQHYLNKFDVGINESDDDDDDDDNEDENEDNENEYDDENGIVQNNSDEIGDSSGNSN
ncbi:very late factor 1 [Pseudoplusia includens SNPV IE]|uniref:Very late factor 1 n=1 Tax=Pseudoplusia includens SNPV IE TaxID=1592335 RepID=A0A0B4ZZU7_9ABAC|nr:very late factor 1 [Pseudoplusia includens SNPV IE]AJD80764.1 very late factor 1 [Pseudoplusia includens SNPV IE]